MWRTQRLNDIDPLHLARYASGADATGYPRSGDTHHYPAQSGSHPGAKARRRHLCLVVSLGSLSGSPGVRPGLRRAVVMGNRR
jgi:hypothetical protein